MSNENGLRNKDVVDLSNYQEVIIVITPDINEISFTSLLKEWNGAIVVKEREEDLVINIKNLKVNSKNQISFDFRGGRNSQYKNILSFSGENEIRSQGNIGICISNNQYLEIRGEDDGELKINGGVEMPALGNNIFTSGSGHLLFSKSGNVLINGGDGYNSTNNRKFKGKSGQYGIGFVNRSFSDISSIKIVDGIGVKIIGGNGEGVSSVSTDKCAGCGGNGVFLDDNGIFEKTGSGVLEILGGNGGGCHGEYGCGLCGNGGCSIEVKSGWINIENPALLSGGKGGSADCTYERVIARGGNGGDGIKITMSEIDNFYKVTKIRIDDFVKVRGGNGGNSGVDFSGEEIKGYNGGNGGSFINSNDYKVYISLGKVSFQGGIPGKGGCGFFEGNKGEAGENFKGENIITSELVKNEKIKFQAQSTEGKNVTVYNSKEEKEYDETTIINPEECSLKKNFDKIGKVFKTILGFLFKDCER